MTRELSTSLLMHIAARAASNLGLWSVLMALVSNK